MFAKKNLVAAAALMALVGAAQADVKVYGALDIAFGSFETAHEKGATGARTTKLDSGDMMTSFIGFSGSEDLGNGLKAEFALESFIGVDTGSNITNNAGQFWSRGSNVALSGAFGKVALGQYDNPLFTSGYTYNPFGSSMAFSPTMRHLSYIGQTSFAGVGFDTGWVNSITYESPNFGGFSFIGQFAPKETTAPETSNSYAVGGTYAAGPFGVSLTYVKGGLTSAITGTAAPFKNTVTGYFADQKVWDLGASYDFGMVKAFAQYTSIKTKKLIGDLDGTGSSLLETGLDAKTTIYQVGVSVPVTDKGTILASYGESKFKGDPAETASKDRVFSLGYDHFLSKRTDVYAVFSNNGRTDLEAGQTFAVGIKHAF
jgi:predicted porin